MHIFKCVVYEYLFISIIEVKDNFFHLSKWKFSERNIKRLIIGKSLF